MLAILLGSQAAAKGPVIKRRILFADFTKGMDLAAVRPHTALSLRFKEWMVREGRLYGKPGHNWTSLFIGKELACDFVVKFDIGFLKPDVHHIQQLRFEFGNPDASKETACLIISPDGTLVFADSQFSGKGDGGVKVKELRPDSLYTVKVKRTDGTLAAKIYPASNPEPDWQISREYSRLEREGEIRLTTWCAPIVLDDILLEEIVSPAPTIVRFAPVTLQGSDARIAATMIDLQPTTQEQARIQQLYELLLRIKYASLDWDRTKYLPDEAMALERLCNSLRLRVAERRTVKLGMSRGGGHYVLWVGIPEESLVYAVCFQDRGGREYIVCLQKFAATATVMDQHCTLSAK